MASKGSSRSGTSGFGSSAIAKAVFLRMPWEANVSRAFHEAEHAQELFDARLGLWLSKTVNLSSKKEMLSYREVVEEAKAFGQKWP